MWMVEMGVVVEEVVVVVLVEAWAVRLLRRSFLYLFNMKVLMLSNFIWLP